METESNNSNPLISLRRNPHQRQFSDTTMTYSYCSLAPSNSEKLLNLKIDHLQTEASNCSSISSTPQSTFRNGHKETPKPISLVIIEKYFSDICQSISSKEIIEKPLLAKATTMQDVLKDCLTAVPDISLQFYVLMASALKEIQQIYTTQDDSLYAALAKKLVQIAGMIEDNKFTSEVDRVNTLPAEEHVEARGLGEISKELLVRINRVTARILNIWKKILSPQREASVISLSFLLLYCEVDPTIKVSSTAKIPATKAVDIMKNYINNPGHVVTILRRTVEYMDKEMISVEVMKRIHDLMEKVTVEQVKTMDKTLTGFVIYELVTYGLKYYEAYAKEHYGINVFEKAVSQDQTRIEEVKSPQELPEPEISIKISTPNIDAIFPNRNLLKTQEKNLKPANKSPVKQPVASSPAPHPKTKLPVSSSSRPSLGVKTTAPDHLPPKRLSDTRPSPKPSNSPSKTNLKPAQKSIFQPKVKNDDKSTGLSRASPARTRSSQGSRVSAPSPTTSKKDFLEEMQYQQFIDEKFRHFLIDKLKQETEKLLEKGFELNDIRTVNEVSSNRNREMWVEEFENSIGQIRGNAGKKIKDEKIFNAEVIRAQRQLDIIQKFGNN